MENFASRIPEKVWKAFGFGLGVLASWSLLTAEHKQENLVPKTSYAHLSNTSSPFAAEEAQPVESRSVASTAEVIEVPSVKTLPATDAQVAVIGEEPTVDLVKGPLRLWKETKVIAAKAGSVKVAKRLAWTKVKNARYYGVQLSRDKDFSDSKTYFTRHNYYPFELYPERKYHWRVRAYTGAKSAISKYSPVYFFKTHQRVPAESGEEDDEILEMEL